MNRVIIAAAFLAIGASAHAGTYNYDGVTVHVAEGCRSSSCVAVYAPGYGSYNGGHAVKVRKAHKDSARVASARKEDVAPTSAAPAAEATPAKTPETTSVATPEAAPQAAPADTTPAK